MVVRARANDTETACRLIGRNPDCAPGAGAVTETGIDSASANRTTAKTVTAAKASGIPPSPRRPNAIGGATAMRSEEHTSELQSLAYLVCRLLLEKKKKINKHLQ